LIEKDKFLLTLIINLVNT